MTTTAPSAGLDEQFAKAVELLAQPNDPNGFVTGVALVEQAASQGHPDAISQLATIEAIGAGRPQNWQRAFDLLSDAAERGSEKARAQLRLLSGKDMDDDWAAVRSAIDIDRLLSAPERETLSENPRIRVVRGFASPAECAWVIGRVRH